MFKGNDLASLDGLETWNVSHVSTFDLAFAGYNQYAYPSASSSSHIVNWDTYANSQLTDISALNTWTGGNNKVQAYSMRGLMRGDYNIASGSAKTYLENAYFKML